MSIEEADGPALWHSGCFLSSSRVWCLDLTPAFSAGKYVIHFGESPAAAAEHTANTIAAAHPDKPKPQITGLAKARNDLAVIPTSTGDQLVRDVQYPTPGCGTPSFPQRSARDAVMSNCPLP
jgi:hypothetical protein